ncbi:ABC transporter permease [Pleionea sediminis]|uniref:ABC transporter permease n=1 Tax=Pleionea sediminis TaxID=2569479 RepID=UPI00118543B3|nr:ABC transporter permease [Pleionea sediminis]
MQIIDYFELLIGLFPALFVIVIMYIWSANYRDGFSALLRMIVQLLLVGYLLTFLFESENSILILAVLLTMVLASSWIALRTVKEHRTKLLKHTIFSVFIGGGIILTIITQGVLSVNPWFDPQYIIPLGGMIFANAMNSVSLCSERYLSELNKGVSEKKARATAYQTSLIPIVNSLFAVGLVSLPGMMTGQILSGVSPLIAVRYQIMVMCMVFASAGFASALFLISSKSIYRTINQTD